MRFVSSDMAVEWVITDDIDRQRLDFLFGVAGCSTVNSTSTAVESMVFMGLISVPSIMFAPIRGIPCPPLVYEKNVIFSRLKTFCI
jgi:hypothetical protein